MLAVIAMLAAFGAEAPVADVPIKRVWEVQFAPLTKREREYAHLGPAGPFYPAKAAERGITGTAVLECVAGREGVLNRCRVLRQTPSGHSFGAAALRLAETRRIRLVQHEAAGTLVRPYVPFSPAD